MAVANFAEAVKLFVGLYQKKSSVLEILEDETILKDIEYLQKEPLYAEDKEREHKTFSRILEALELLQKTNHEISVVINPYAPGTENHEYYDEFKSYTAKEERFRQEFLSHTVEPILQNQKYNEIWSIHFKNYEQFLDDIHKSVVLLKKLVLYHRAEGIYYIIQLIKLLRFQAARLFLDSKHSEAALSSKQRDFFGRLLNYLLASQEIIFKEAKGLNADAEDSLPGIKAKCEEFYAESEKCLDSGQHQKLKDAIISVIKQQAEMLSAFKRRKESIDIGSLCKSLKPDLGYFEIYQRFKFSFGALAENYLEHGKTSSKFPYKGFFGDTAFLNICFAENRAHFYGCYVILTRLYNGKGFLYSHGETMTDIENRGPNPYVIFIIDEYKKLESLFNAFSKPGNFLYFINFLYSLPNIGRVDYFEGNVMLTSKEEIPTTKLIELPNKSDFKLKVNTISFEVYVDGSKKSFDVTDLKGDAVKIPFNYKDADFHIKLETKNCNGFLCYYEVYSIKPEKTDLYTKAFVGAITSNNQSFTINQKLYLGDYKFIFKISPVPLLTESCYEYVFTIELKQYDTKELVKNVGVLAYAGFDPKAPQGWGYRERIRFGNIPYIDSGLGDRSALLDNGDVSFGIGIKNNIRFLILRQLQNRESRGGYPYSVLINPGDFIWNTCGWNAALLAHNISQNADLNSMVLKNPIRCCIRCHSYRRKTPQTLFNPLCGPFFFWLGSFERCSG